MSLNNPASGTDGASTDATINDVADLISDSDLGYEQPEEESEETPPQEPEQPEGEEPEQAEESEEEETAETEVEQPKIKLKDAEYTLPELQAKLDELESGALRQSDYTRKMQSLAEERRDFEARIKPAETELQQGLALLASVWNDVLPKMPPADMLESDPIGYIQAKQAYDDRMKALNDLGSLQQKQVAKASQAQAKAMQEHRQIEAQALIKALPELATADGKKAFLSDIDKYGAPYGLTSEEVMSIEDHRALVVLKDAMAFQKLKASKPAAIQKAKATPPMPATVRGATSQTMLAQKRALERLRSEQSIDAAVDAITDADLGM